MTQRERLAAALNRKQPDRIPVGKVDFCGTLLKKFQDKTGESDPNVYFNVPTRLVGGWASGAGGAMVGGAHMWKGDIDYSPYLPSLPKNARLMVKGDGYLSGDDDLETYLFPLLPMQSVDELLRYPWWEAERKTAKRRSSEELKVRVDGLKAKDLFVLGWVGNPFESAWKLRGFERFMLDLAEASEFATTLLDLCTEACCANARYVAQAGADVLFLYDDIAMHSGLFFSPDVFRQWLMPRYRKILAAGRAIKPDIAAFFHTDGKATDMVPLIIESGFTVLNPVQPECMDPAETKRRFGEHLAFWGTVGVQRTMPFGTPREVSEEVRLRCRTVGRGGGFVISPAQTLYADVPWENVLAFFEAVEKYAGYR